MQLFHLLLVTGASAFTAPAQFTTTHVVQRRTRPLRMGVFDEIKTVSAQPKRSKCGTPALYLFSCTAADPALSRPSVQSQTGRPSTSTGRRPLTGEERPPTRACFGRRHCSGCAAFDASQALRVPSGLSSDGVAFYPFLPEDTSSWPNAR